MAPSTERILVIGGTGRIGLHATRLLAETRHEIAVYHRGIAEPDLPQRITHFHASNAALPIVSYPASLLKWAPTIVVHMICMGEADSQACVRAFHGVAKRCVAISSGDVYAVFGRFLRLESGPPTAVSQTEEAPLRSVLFPYRVGSPEQSLEYRYEKQLVERAFASVDWEWVVLRLPKVYGPGINQDLATVYDHADQPSWRWTHGYSINVAAAIALAALHPAASRRIYNVGETVTPTMGERLSRLPPRAPRARPCAHRDFSHDIVLDTTRIRSELGYVEIFPEDEAMRMCATSRP